jgi:type II secretory ATPase GspE/PulE/Tfp pilus assembly ATPase PilB-like protein
MMSAMISAETRLPQDGRFQVCVAGRVIDIRVSAAPCASGESIVMRFLYPDQQPATLDALEFLPSQLEMLRSWCRKPSGIIIVTGPSGSGKTTTLYGLLNELNTPAAKVMTVEDPVRFLLKGVGQMQVNPAIGLTFPVLLRSQLRQDADVIMIGEIRDVETAQIAVQASRDAQYYNGKGCEKCEQTGYRQRTAVYSLLPMTDAVMLTLARDEQPEDLWRAAAEAGMQTLREAGLAKAAAGITTLEEVMRMCG